LSALPAFIIGITEDVTKSVGVQTRLTITMVAAACGAWLLNGIVTRVDIPILNQAFTWVPLAIAFTIFSVAGVSNAMNIIDGYNGLAAGYAFIVLSALAYVSSTIGDMFLFISSIAMMGALVGFLAFINPKGKIFLGDSGAYLLGFWVAELSVLLVARHPEISPWFPLALLIYPIFETVFSIYRRQVVRGNSPGHPDRLHMHQMIYMRLVRRFVGRSEAGLITYRNSMVAPYVWVVALLCCGLAVAARASTGWLLLIIVVFCAAYVRVYALIVHWKTPTWLIVRPRTQ
jgi:UDP-N-acetylmuramyl pentapeptide phosphotransferase/UDP-N-acetylglucosamine-1-phosphate transferase